MKALNFVAVVVMILGAAGCLPRGGGDAAWLDRRASWFPLGEEVYQENDRDEAATKELAFLPEPRWFISDQLTFYFLAGEEGYNEYLVDVNQGRSRQKQWEQWPQARIPYPRRINEVPLKDIGASLTMEGMPSDSPKILRLRMTLQAGERSAWRAVEHRWTNVLPFLFAFVADGMPVRKEQSGGGHFGGEPDEVILVKAGQSRTWELSVDSKSIDAIVPKGTHSLILMAAFSEMQHCGVFDESASDSTSIMVVGEQQYNEVVVGPASNSAWNKWNQATPLRPILVRSNPVRLQRTADGWTIIEEPKGVPIGH